MTSFPTHPAMQSSLDAQLGFLNDLTRHASDSMRRLNEVHLQFAQQVMQDVTDASRAVLNCSDPFQAAAAVARAAKPATEHLRNYQQQLISLLSGAQLDLSRSVEAFVPQASSDAAALAASMSHDGAKSGTEASAAARDSAADTRSRGGNGSRHSPS